MLKKVLNILLVLLLLGCLSGCGDKKEAVVLEKNDAGNDTVEVVEEKGEITGVHANAATSGGVTKIELIGVDEKNVDLWTWSGEIPCQSDEMEEFQEIGFWKDDYCFISNGDIYCVIARGENAGSMKWQYENYSGVGTMFALSSEDELWLCDELDRALFVINNEGEVQCEISYFDEPYSKHFWPEEIRALDNGTMEIRYESSDMILSFDAISYEILDERSVVPISIDKLFGVWKGTTYEIEGDLELMDEVGMSAELIINEDNTFDFLYVYQDIDYFCVEEIPFEMTLGKIYTTAKTPAGSFYLEAQSNEENAWSIAMTDEDTIEMLWYIGEWTEEQYPSVVSMCFVPYKGE